MPRVSEKKVLNVLAHKKGARKPGVGRIRGHGDYSYDNPGPWGKAGSYLGGRVGKHFLGEPGKVVGSKLGSYLHYIGKIFGSGDYVTSAMTPKSNSVLSAQIPEFHGKSGYNRIRHREFLGDVRSSATANTFKIDSYAINPGLFASLPWLSQVCGATYQQYRINGMVFEFRSMSSDALNSTNTALGSVIMATDYDSKDAVFNTKQQMENSEFGVSCKPSQSMLHAIECARNKTSVSELYIRAHDVPDGADIRLYDLGRFSIASTGCQGTNVNLGELWVSYDIDLIKAIEQPPGYIYPMAHFHLSGASAATPLALDTTSTKTGYVGYAYDSIGLTRSDTVITFPLTIPTNSVWLVNLAYRGASTASIVGPNLTLAGGMVQANLFANLGSAGYGAPQTVTGTTIITVAAYYYDGSGTAAVPPTITFSTGGTFPGTPAGADLIIQMIPGIGVSTSGTGLS